MNGTRHERHSDDDGHHSGMRARMIGCTVHSSVALAIAVSILFGCAAAGTAGDSGGGSRNGGAPEVSVFNYSYAPLKNVSINGVSVGDFQPYDTGNDSEIVPIRVTIPRSDVYILTAEVDFSSGEVFSFSYELDDNLLERGTVRIGLPDTYIALHIVNSDLRLLDDPEIRISYGGFVTSARPDTDRFLGVFNRLGTQGRVDITWSNNSWDFNSAEVRTTWGGYYMWFGT